MTAEDCSHSRKMIAEIVLAEAVSTGSIMPIPCRMIIRFASPTWNGLCRTGRLPGVDFSRALMVGNNISDMEFGKNAGMYTVFLTTTRPDQPLPTPLLTWLSVRCTILRNICVSDEIFLRYLTFALSGSVLGSPVL